MTHTAQMKPFGIFAAFVLALTIAAPAQAYHGRPMHPITREAGAPVTLDEWQAVQVGWSRFHVQNVFDNLGVLNGTWTEGAVTYKQKTYPSDATHNAVIVYTETNDSPDWAVSIKEWCTQIPTGEWSCLAGS